MNTAAETFFLYPLPVTAMIKRKQIKKTGNGYYQYIIPYKKNWKWTLSIYNTI
jgi:hypothetical protein